jgi:hypothetical protein
LMAFAPTYDDTPHTAHFGRSLEWLRQRHCIWPNILGM